MKINCPFCNSILYGENEYDFICFSYECVNCKCSINSFIDNDEIEHISSFDINYLYNNVKYALICPYDPGTEICIYDNDDECFKKIISVNYDNIITPKDAYNFLMYKLPIYLVFK